ncbi:MULTISPECIES: hypothetical protein [Desulfovibrio]|uniref:Uncharacterized protein n=2 Tax=Desulfovibrio desulfuricans TaxID=876 RepID=A0AA94HUL5_DESDE|nr:MULTISPECIES: hypothetical protein [Desulfovibrio]ATD81358.1 hypothetical protein CNY67_08150 [Desulfovibrio sp. G11]MDY0203705.1 hypothetical protein [Desulfovibrio desulfuricans]SFW67231.1 hypothetical protein SAMN02910291_02426 [Desulfovibrio desulfuricans]SPD37006.1 Hypothetical protein DSVG11_2978 [Desulfovibrio sp. G11]
MMPYQPEQSAPSPPALQKRHAPGPAILLATGEESEHAEPPSGASALTPQTLAVCPPFLSGKLLARMTPWPVDSINAPLNASPEALWHMTGAPVSLVRMAYELFCRPPSAAEDLLRLASSAADEVLVVDFKCAERNLELPAVALVNFLPDLRRVARTAFLKTGGLEGLVFRTGLKIVERRTVLAGAAVMLRLRTN